MQNIELRWAKRVVGKQHGPRGEPGFNDVVTLILQYRTKQDHTMYAGIGPFNVSKDIRWSEWIDVPTVSEGV